MAAFLDPSAEIEPLGLIPSYPTLRPADVLSSAASRRPAAYDVGVISTDAQDAGAARCTKHVR
eukprot:8802808-Karenia_brevis.AAC.1